MSFESFRVAANSQLSVWANDVHEKAANVSEETLKATQGALVIIAIIATANNLYNLYNGDFSYIWGAGPATVIFMMEKGINYIQAVKTSEFNILKNKMQNAVVNEAKVLHQDWAEKTDEEILELTKSLDMDYLTKIVININPDQREAFIPITAKHYVENSGLTQKKA